MKYTGYPENVYRCGWVKRCAFRPRSHCSVFVMTRFVASKAQRKSPLIEASFSNSATPSEEGLSIDHDSLSMNIDRLLIISHE